MYQLFKVSGKSFLNATLPVHKVWSHMNKSITMPPRMDAQFYLDPHDSMGYGVAKDGELIALWSLVRGQGYNLVQDAVRNGATWLTCYDNGFLVEFYVRCGFDITGREPNRVDGQPDVVRLAWRT